MRIQNDHKEKQTRAAKKDRSTSSISKTANDPGSLHSPRGQLDAQRVIAMQRTYGNRVVQRLIDANKIQRSWHELSGSEVQHSSTELQLVIGPDADKVTQVRVNYSDVWESGNLRVEGGVLFVNAFYTSNPSIVEYWLEGDTADSDATVVKDPTAAPSEIDQTPTVDQAPSAGAAPPATDTTSTADAGEASTVSRPNTIPQNHWDKLSDQAKKDLEDCVSKEAYINWLLDQIDNLNKTLDHPSAHRKLLEGKADINTLVDAYTVLEKHSDGQLKARDARTKLDDIL